MADRGVSSEDHTDLGRAVRERCRVLGFDVVGIARADLPLDRDYERYARFLGAGMHGEMGFLGDDAAVRERLDGEGILAGAKSVVCVARAYAGDAEQERATPEIARGIARYARGHDYHNGLRKKLRQLAAWMRTLGPDVRARPLCDTAPVLERAWAARAGLGFVGKNGLLIVPGVGSLVLLGEVVTTLELEPDPPIPERCGACTRCLEACPTSAFVEPFVLDPRRCVAYLTIEKRSATVDAALRAGIGEHLFGCDDCQTVCPFNAGARARDTPRRHARPLEAWSSIELADLLALDDARPFPESLAGSPVKRATQAGLARNAAIVLGNRGRADARTLAALEKAAREHASAVVREAAVWALARVTAG